MSKPGTHANPFPVPHPTPSRCRTPQRGRSLPVQMYCMSQYSVVALGGASPAARNSSLMNRINGPFGA
jgi:hypothetical protein